MIGSYSHKSYRSETKHKMCVSHKVYLFLHHIVSLSLDTRSPSLNMFFEIVAVKLCACSRKILPKQLEQVHRTWDGILLDVSWELQTTRSQTLPNPCCTESMGKPQAWCSVSPLKLQIYYGVWRYILMKH
jgi:hypothetical protein